MSRASLIFFFIFMNQTNLAVGQNECNVNADCSNQYKVCCEESFLNRRKTCQLSSCLGHPCLTDGDCSGKGECCKSNQCVTIGCPECYSNFACATSEYCCKQRYISDHNVCRRSCVGETCHSNSDCGGSGEYNCNSNFKCTKSVNSATLADWEIGIIVVGAILLVIIIGGVFYAVVNYNKHSQPGVVLQQSAQGAAQPHYAKPTVSLQLTGPTALPQAASQLHNPKPTPHLPEPTAPPQILNPPRNARIPHLNRVVNIVRSQVQDFLSEGLDNTSPEGLDNTSPEGFDNTSPEGLDFTSLQSPDFTDMGEINFDCAM